MSDPAVTVVVTCFNYGRYLPESVGSVLEQTLRDFELIIVDDGSTDDSLAVARSLAARDARITLITQPNAGQPAIPRNLAISRARGRYIVCLDADDRLGANVLERCKAELDADPQAGLAWARLQEVGGTNTLHDHPDWSIERLRSRNYVPCTTMFRREAWEAAGGYNTNVRGYEDWDLWLGIAEAGFTGRAARGAVWYYRLHGAGLFEASKGHDQLRKAQIAVNRPGVFSDGVLAWARGVLAEDPAALAVPHALGVFPSVPEPDRPFVVTRHRSERADWYVDVDGLEAPWPGRTLSEALAAVDALGYTRVHAEGMEVARKRASDPVVYPLPFFTQAIDAAERARALAEAAESLVLVGALRTAGTFDAGRTAAYVGIAPTELAELASEAQSLVRTAEPVPVQRAAALSRMAAVLRAERIQAGDAEGARSAASLERAAARAGLEQARSVAVLAFSDELVADPALLEAYGRAIAGADDMTLVIVTSDPEPLVEAVAAAGLDREDAADLIAVSTPPPGVTALLSRREHGGLPRYDETSVAALRELMAA
ncbi:MAG: glycosyltransferase family 2 protein [Solirubrobacteraceae bacterium]